MLNLYYFISSLRLNSYSRHLHSLIVRCYMILQAPSRNWKIYSNSDAMVKDIQDVMDWIDQLLAEETEILCIKEEGQSHYLHQTTDSNKFFKLVLQPDVEALAAGQAIEGVTLVFNLKDLYLLGFLHNNIWYFYSDAGLEGSGHNEPGNEKFWDKLPFSGGYINDMFKNIKVGAYELNISHHALSQYLTRLKKGQQDEIQTALYRIIVVISEAKRFPQWLQVLHKSFADKLSMVAGSTFGVLFQNWSKLCRKVFKGPENFKPNKNFATYGELVSTVSVLLSSAFSDDDESMESIDWKSHEPKFVFDPDYDMEDEAVVDDEEEDEVVDEEEGEEVVDDEEGAECEEKEMEQKEEEDTDQMEEDEEDAMAEEDKKSGGRGHKCCYWVVFFICIMLLLVWMTVF